MSSPLLTKLAKKNHRLRDLETTSKQTSGGAGTSHYPASTGKLGPFLHDNGQQQRTMVHLKSRAKHQDLEAEERTSAQHHRHIDEAPNAAAPSIVQKPVNFPTSIRKRSIPYGFDFDLDEVWAPLNPHLRGALCKSGSAGSHSEGSSSSCSDSSIHTGYLGLKQPQRPPMQSVVFGDSSEDSRVPTARLSGRGCPAGGRLSQQEDAEEFAVENEDIFMQINNLSISDEPSEAKEHSSNKDENEAIITNLGLPSARTLRGGASIVARGRYGSHAGSLNEVPNSAMSNYSNYSSSSSRFSSGSSPTPSRHLNVGSNSFSASPGKGLTPGLVSDQRKSKTSSPTATTKAIAASSPRKLNKSNL